MRTELEKKDSAWYADVIYNLATESGWKNIPVKQSYTFSFIKDNKRMNFWYKTGTVQIQDTTKKFDKGSVYKDVSQKEFNEIVCHHPVRQ
jgi:hypothetical protein